MPRCTGPNGEAVEVPVFNEPTSVSEIPAYQPFLREFDEIRQINPLAVSSGWLPLTWWQCPEGRQGFAQGFGYAVEVGQEAAYTGQIQFRVRVGNDVRLLYPPLAQFASMFQSDLTKLHIWLNPLDTIYIDVSNANTTDTYCVIARVKGIHFPAQVRL